jgi:hypothetical protein
MMRLFITCLVFSASVAPVGSLSAQDVTTISGCYEFDRIYFFWFSRALQGGMRTDSSRVLHLLATTDDARRSGETRVFEVRPVPFTVDSFTLRRWGRTSYWSVDTQGVVEVSWREGTFGPAFRLTAVGDTLRGQVQQMPGLLSGWQSPPEDAWAVRTRCP